MCQIFLSASTKRVDIDAIHRCYCTGNHNLLRNNPNKAIKYFISVMATLTGENTDHLPAKCAHLLMETEFSLVSKIQQYIRMEDRDREGQLRTKLVRVMII